MNTSLSGPILHASMDPTRRFIVTSSRPQISPPQRHPRPLPASPLLQLWDVTNGQLVASEVIPTPNTTPSSTFSDTISSLNFIDPSVVAVGKDGGQVQLFLVDVSCG